MGREKEAEEEERHCRFDFDDIYFNVKLWQIEMSTLPIQLKFVIILLACCRLLQHENKLNVE